MPTNTRYQITRVITPADSLAIVTLEQAKAALGIPVEDTSQDVALTAQIEAVSVAVNNYCGRVFVVQGYQDRLRYVHNWLNPGEPLRTRQYPIVVDNVDGPVVAVVEDGAEVDPAVLEVYPEQGELFRADGNVAGEWTGTNILINYTAGFDPIPADVRSATLEWLQARWGSSGRDPGLRSETIPDLITQVYASSDSISASSVPAGASSLLAGYRMWWV